MKKYLLIFLLLAALPAIFYVQYQRQAEDIILNNEELQQQGVLQLNRSKVAEGINLFHNEHDRAFLMDQQGNLAHQWDIPGVKKHNLHHVELGEDGYLYVIYQVRSLLKVDKDSNLIWRNAFSAHHDLAFDLDGQIVTIGKKFKKYQHNGHDYTIFVDTLVKIDKQSGQIIWEKDLLQLLAPFTEYPLVQREYKSELKLGGTPDMFHCNSIQVVNKDHPNLAKKGDILLGVRNASVMLVIDPKTFTTRSTIEIPGVEMLHQAELLPNGNITLFDNGVLRRWSRAVEYSPSQKKIVWQFPKKANRKLFSATRGGVQRLDNNNTLINFSRADYAVELSSKDEILWVFEYEKSKLLVDDRWRTFKGPYRMERITHW